MPPPGIRPTGSSEKLKLQEGSEVVASSTTVDKSNATKEANGNGKVIEGDKDSRAKETVVDDIKTLVKYANTVRKDGSGSIPLAQRRLRKAKRLARKLQSRLRPGDERSGTARKILALIKRTERDMDAKPGSNNNFSSGSEYSESEYSDSDGESVFSDSYSSSYSDDDDDGAPGEGGRDVDMWLLRKLQKQWRDIFVDMKSGELRRRERNIEKREAMLQRREMTDTIEDVMMSHRSGSPRAFNSSFTLPSSTKPQSLDAFLPSAKARRFDDTLGKRLQARKGSSNAFSGIGLVTYLPPPPPGVRSGEKILASNQSNGNVTTVTTTATAQAKGTATNAMQNLNSLDTIPGFQKALGMNIGGSFGRPPPVHPSLAARSSSVMPPRPRGVKPRPSLPAPAGAPRPGRGMKPRPSLPAPTGAPRPGRGVKPRPSLPAPAGAPRPGRGSEAEAISTRTCGGTKARSRSEAKTVSAC